MLPDLLKTDLKLTFKIEQDMMTADLEIGQGDLETVSGLDNLVQALRLRLLTDRGELADLGHPRYGTRIRDILGEPLNHANRELIRRYVRQTLLQDYRVKEVLQVRVEPRIQEPGAVDAHAVITAVSNEQTVIDVTFRQ